MTHLNGAPTDSPLGHYLAVLWRRKGLVLVTLAVTIAAAAYYSFRQPAIYQSATEVHLRPPLLSALGESQKPNLEEEALLARSVPVAERAGRLLGDPAPPADLLSGLSVAPVQPGASVLRFSYTARDPVVAQRRAQTFATAYLEYRSDELLTELDNVAMPLREQSQVLRTRLSELYQRSRATADPNERQMLVAEAQTLSSQLLSLQERLQQLLPPGDLQFGSIIRPADVPVAPSGPNRRGDLLLALLVGTALAAGLAILIDRLDGRVRGREELEAALGAPVLAAVPTVSPWRNGSPLVTLTAPQSAAAEAYRALRTSILLNKSEEPVRTLLVTSVDATHASTVACANLAIVLALAGLKTAIVAADLSRPRQLHSLFEERPELAGAVQLFELAVLLHGAERVERVARTLMTPSRVDNVSSTREWGQFFRLASALPVGEVQAGDPTIPEGLCSSPGDLLASDILPKVIADLRTRAEFVILDGPPLPAGVDATILASAVDGVLLVARAGRTGREMLTRAERDLSRVGTKVVGTVVYQ
ncbi:MAG: Wzz/FepE/Etk N-terminal domain-containing protein [Actinomycetota bacterium]|nr:Wzz/FepE/Etk N-terminal domain-containing protein [Actinomycetota bacterium]